MVFLRQVTGGCRQAMFLFPISSFMKKFNFSDFVFINLSPLARSAWLLPTWCGLSLQVKTIWSFCRDKQWESPHMLSSDHRELRESSLSGGGWWLVNVELYMKFELFHLKSFTHDNDPTLVWCQSSSESYHLGIKNLVHSLSLHWSRPLARFSLKEEACLCRVRVYIECRL